MKQVPGSAQRPDTHYVTVLTRQRCCSVPACSIRTAAATFSCASSEESLDLRPIQPDLQDVMLCDMITAAPPAAFDTLVNSNGNGSRRRLLQRHVLQPQHYKQQQQQRQHGDDGGGCDDQAPCTQHSHLEQQQLQQEPVQQQHLAQVWDVNSDSSSCLPQQQQQQRHTSGRIARQWSSMRNWQWLASQQQCTGSSSGSSTLQLTVNILTQLAQPGVAPSRIDVQQRQRFNSFLAQLLLTALQQLRAAAAAAVSSSDVTDLLWGLAKLGVEPQWAVEPPQQQQQQPWQQSCPVAVAVRQRAADIVTAATHVMMQHLQQDQQQQQQDQQQCAMYCPRQLALCGWALAKLQYPAAAGQGFWQQYLAAVQQQLPAFSAQDLSQITWALARLQCMPSGSWSQALLDAALSTLSSSSSVSGQSVAVLLLSLAQLGVTPESDWLDSVLLAMQQQQRQCGRALLQQLDSHALSSVLGALAKWGHVPQQHWMQTMQEVLQQQVEQCNGQDVAQISWALATLTAAAAGSTGNSSDSSSDEQESGLVKLRRQLWYNRLQGSSSSGSDSSSLHGLARARYSMQQQQQQQHIVQMQPSALHINEGLLAQLAHRLCETAHSSPSCQLVLGMWGLTKLYQLMQQTEPYSNSRYGTVGDRQADPQRQQQRWHHQYWHPCRSLLIRCTAVLHQQRSLQALDCKHMAMLVWSLAAAGGTSSSSSNSQQQHAQQHRHELAHSRGSSSSSRSFMIPDPLVHQIVTASRSGLATGDCHSQALLIRGLVNLGVQPSWQWLLRFYESSEPQLHLSTAQDLSMMAAALAQLNLRPLGSWSVRFLEVSKTLAEAQGFDVECLTIVAAAVTGRSWGLTAVADQGAGVCSSRVGQQQQQQQHVEVLVAGWSSAMQQQVVRLLPKLSLAQVAVLLRVAAALRWTDSNTSSSSSSSSSRESSCVVSGLLNAGMRLTSQQHTRQQQSLVMQTSAARPDRVVGLLRVMTAAAVLPNSSVPDSWWLHMAASFHNTIQQQQQQQQGCRTMLRPQQLSAGMKLLAAIVIRQQQRCSQQQQQQQSVPQLLACLQALIVAASDQVTELPVLQSLQLLLTADHSLRSVRPQGNLIRTCPDNIGPEIQAAGGPDRDDHQAVEQMRTRSTYAAEGSAGHRPGCAALKILSGPAAAAGPDDQAGCQAALHQLRSTVQDVCREQLPQMSLEQLAAALFIASRCGLLQQQQQQQQQQREASAVVSFQSVSPVLSLGLSVLGQRLAHVQFQQQQQQQPGLAAPLAVAGPLVSVLHALVTCGYRPGSKLLRRVLYHIQPELSNLDPQQLLVIADAAALLRLGRVLCLGFRSLFWQSISQALKNCYCSTSARTAAAAMVQKQSAATAVGGASAGRHTGSSGFQSACGSSRCSSGSSDSIQDVLCLLHALHVLTLPHVPASIAQMCSSISDCSRTQLRSHHAAAAAAVADKYPCSRRSQGLGVPPPRLVILQAFKAAAAAWRGSGTRVSSSSQQQQQQQLLLSLRLSVPLASRLSKDGLHQFCRAIGPQLQQLPDPARRQALRLMKQLVTAYMIGRQHRQAIVLMQRKGELLQQHREAAVLQQQQPPVVQANPELPDDAVVVGKDEQPQLVEALL